MFYLSQELFLRFLKLGHIVAFGGDLSTERLQLAYLVFFLGLKMENLSLGGHLIPEWFCFWMSWWFKSMRNILNRNIFTVTFNQILER
jgi:leucyl/phenylalanyl-tRNA--protein transferase